MTYSRLRHREGIYHLYLIQDITDVLEKESIKKQMEAYQQTIATVSHYINNILHALQLKKEMVENKFDSHEGIQEISQFINYSTQKITYILEILDEQIQRGEIKTSNYANIENLLIDIHKYVEEFDMKYKNKNL